MALPVQEIQKQIDSTLGEYTKTRKHLDYEGSEADAVRLVTKLHDVILRFAPPGSAYLKKCDEIVGKQWADSYKADSLKGIVEALKDAYSNGALQSVGELVRGELFSDFLDMASYLLQEGFKDAAAVIAGSALENHLRNLCKKVGVPVLKPDQSPKKADTLNGDLKTANVYGLLESKNVTFWLDLRNNAAHGHYSKYAAPQVELLISGLREFFARIPA